MPLYRRMALACIALAIRIPSLADTFSSTVTVVFQNGQTTITPFEPTINLAASPSVVLDVRPGDALFQVTPVLAVDALRLEALSQRDKVSSPKNSKLYGALTKLANAPTQENLRATIKAIEDAATSPDPSTGRTLNSEQKETLDAAKKSLEEAGQSVTQSSNRFLLNFHRGWWWEYKYGDRSRTWDQHQDCQKDEKDPTKKHCRHEDFVKVLPGAGWDIYLTNRTYAFDFPVVIECTSECPGGSLSRLLVIHVDTASWGTSLSAGLMFPFLRDERYSVNANNELVRLSDGDIPYSAATYLHYCPINGVPVLTAFCPTLAVGSKVPSDGVLVGLGLAGHIKPLESVNAAYFDLGVAYGHRKTLNDTYLAQPRPITVPTGTNPADVLSTHYAFRFFVGLSIGITGGIDKFRGVFPGAGGTSSQVQPAPGETNTPAASQTPTVTTTPTVTPTPTPTPH